MTTQSVPQMKTENDEDPYDSYLQDLLERLEYDLNRYLIAIEAKSDSSPKHRRFARMERTFVNQDAERVDDFYASFEAHHGRILLLGESGAGKTISLLSIARDATLKRLNNPNAALPIFAKIAAWDADHPDGEQAFFDWLAKESGLSAETIQKEMNANKCILFLDGLDDLNNINRDQTTMFNPRIRFIMQIPAKTQFVMTCRSAEYAKVNYSIPDSGTLELQRLSDDQIHDYLHLTSTPPQLWQMLQYYKDLLDIIRTPLALRLFVLAYHDLPENMLELPDYEPDELRDKVFDHYIERRYQHEVEYYERHSEKVPFTLKKIYDMLGNIAKHNAVKYGSGLYATGKWAFLPLNDPEWGEWLIISDLPFGFFGAETKKSDEFIQFVSRLQLIHSTENKTCFFSHALLRDYFVYKHCLPIEDAPDSFTIEALSRIKDRRTIPVFADIIRKPIDVNLCVQALNALTALPYTERLPQLFELIDDNLEEEIQHRIDYYVSKVPRQQIREAIEQWQQVDAQAAENSRKYWEQYID